MSQAGNHPSTWWSQGQWKVNKWSFTYLLLLKVLNWCLRSSTKGMKKLRQNSLWKYGERWVITVITAVCNCFWQSISCTLCIMKQLSHGVQTNLQNILGWFLFSVTVTKIPSDSLLMLMVTVTVTMMDNKPFSTDISCLHQDPVQHLPSSKAYS